MNEFGILHIKDEKFNPAQTRDMQLLIKIAPGRFSYAIINEKESRLQVLYDSPLSDGLNGMLSNLLSENEYLGSSFAAVKASVQTFNFTLIPTSYYTRDDLPNYENLIQASEETKTFISTINLEGINCVSALPSETIAALTNFFPGIRFFSQVEPFVEGGLKANDTDAQKVFIQFNEKSVEVSLSNDDKLVFYNLFNVENADDFNYYILNILHQFKIEPQNTAVFLSGNIDAGDANYRRVEKYFKDIRFADSSQITLFSSNFERLPKHQHFSLISLLLCE
ncbi:DUF3822 family protein [Paradesertivirga mongoliensis]|uniref:DUF3822 family protein n=1 Tax=Paradesertivirga mongoliensis TaxID=2100740 RepID=A0ABW4ZQR7_9SPHI|nr:DUF3822 family protein [Pedobacter mongoliensis]